MFQSISRDIFAPLLKYNSSYTPLMNKKINKFTIFLLSKMHFVNRLIKIKTLIKGTGC